MRQELTALLEKYEARIHGQPMNLKLLLTAILADGHVLVEGVPGTGKTKMVWTLANLLNGKFNRIQFTPDLLPSDITGSTIYNMQEGTFQTLKGPIFSNILLADEINRTPAKTQAALLEAMEEKQVTIQGNTYPLPDVFFVVATQNPIEFEGTYPLPEAQEDRFLLKLIIDFPALEAETDVLRQELLDHGEREMKAEMDVETFSSIQKEIKAVTINDDVIAYIMKMVRKTRDMEAIRFGASTRAAISIAKAARSWAYLSERDYVTPDDIKAVAKPALRHRVQLSPHTELEGVGVDEITEELIGSIPVPR